VTLVVASLAALLATTPAPPTPERFDVVVYGGNAAGVVAAVQARHMGRTVVLLEPGRRLGGLTSGGLGNTDIGSKGAVGGLSRRF
jgi:predicted flavoprotein YhiN